MTDKIRAPLKRNWSFIIFIFLSLVISVFPRDSFMHRISSSWRPSQTLLTSFWFQKEGISLFHSQLPLFGPPWEVPFEFPVYQAISAVFSNTTHLNLTAASRVVSVASFYVSAFFLLLLCLEFLNNKTLSAIIFFVYLFLPYNIRYSTEILIDYLSVAMALGYIFWIKKYIDSPKNLIYFLLAVIFGCLGATIKITTMAIIIIPAILIAIEGIQNWGFQLSDLRMPNKLISKIGKHKLPLILLATIAILPIASVGFWTKFADAIKGANIFTFWLTSVNLTSWNYGTLDQKMNYLNWWRWFMNINNYFFLGGILLIFPIFGIVFLFRMPAKSRVFFATAFSSVILTIFIFFNLYLHQYYYIAVSALLSILIGYGIYCLVKLLPARRILRILFLGIFSIFTIIAGIGQYRSFQVDVQAEIDYTRTTIIPLANKVTAITSENEYIISFQSDWYPDFILYTQRKGLVISPREADKYSCELINKYDYGTIVVVNPTLDMPPLTKMFDCFKSVTLIELGIYKVTQ